MKKMVSVLFLSLALAGCSTNQATQQKNDLKEVVWNQLSKEAKEEIVGTWENAKVEKVTLQNHAFQNSEQYMGKELLRVSFDSSKTTLGPVVVYVDPENKKIVGYGLRD